MSDSRLEKHKPRLKLRYANMEVADKCDDLNAIHRWNRFKREVIKKPNYYKNHSSLCEDKRALLETTLDVNISDQTFCGLYHRLQNIMIKKYILNKDHECLWRIRSHGRT